VRTLTASEIREVQSSQISQIEGDVEAIFDFLTENGPFHGPARDMAAEIGITLIRLDSALGRIRKETEINGWTIPFVRKGGFSKQVYAVVPTEGTKTEEESDLLRDGVERHGAQLIGMLDNVRRLVS
jgi:hypothetical protein